MPDFQRMTVKLEYSLLSDFSAIDGQSKFDTYEPTTNNRPDSFEYKGRIQIDTGGFTFDLGMYTTVTDIVVQNVDTANYVDLSFRSPAAIAATNSGIRVQPGQIVSVGAATPANDLLMTANTADVFVKVWISGVAVA